MTNIEGPPTGGIIGRLVEVSTKHPKGVDRALNVATVMVALAILAVTIETIKEGALVQPALQLLTDATQAVGQQIGQGLLAPR